MQLISAPKQASKHFFATYQFLALFGVVLVFVSVYLWKSQQARNLEQLSARTAAQARTLASEIEIEYQKIFDTLERLALETAPTGTKGVEQWHQDAALYINIFEGIEAIAWVDETFHIRQIEPSQTFSAVVNQAANEVDWDPSTVILWLASDSDLTFNGFLLGIIDISGVISPVLGETTSDYMLQLSKQGRTVYSSENWHPPEEKYLVSRTITLQDTDSLTLRLAPAPVTLSGEIANARITLYFGLMFSAIALVAVFLAQNFNMLAMGFELRYRNLFQASRDAIYIIDMDGNYQDANPAALELVGYSSAELQQMTVDDLRAQPDTLSAADRSQLWKHGGELEFSLRHRKGKTVPVDMVVSPIPGDHDQKYVLGIARDISERLQAEKELKRYAEQLEEMVKKRTHALEKAQEKLVRQERLAILGQLAGGVGHELRNPLGVISNAIYFLEMVIPEKDGKVQEYLTLIQTNVEEATQIVNDLLGFARQKSSTPLSLSVDEFVRTSLSQLPPPEGIQVDLDIPAELPNLFVDPNHIKQVITNLVTNAYQAIEDEGQIAITAQKVDEGVSISVADTGAGIAPENQDKIFEPLFTTKLKGIGLGLALSKMLVEVNQGRIEFESQVGAGTVFTVTLPVQEGSIS